MRTFFIVAFSFLVLLPFPAAAQFGPIVPEACKDCACGFAGVLAIIQNLVNFVIALAVIVATIIIAWGGFLYILSPANPGNRSLANKMLINAAIGLVITLSAWLIVDFVMKTLYGGQQGPWNSILYSATDDMCIQSKPQKGLFSGGIFTTPGPDTTTGGGGSNCPAAARTDMVAFPASVTSGETEYATPQTVQNFMNMHAAAARDGITLLVVDGHRSEEEQVQLWNRYQSGAGGVAARPCSQGGNGSNHNSGQAIDIAVGCSNGNSNCNTATYRWLKQNGAQYGFRNAIQSDPVHWSPSGR